VKITGSLIRSCGNISLTLFVAIVPPLITIEGKKVSGQKGRNSSVLPPPVYLFCSSLLIFLS
ncbi:MAG: hypothetical protein LUO98_02050, partial [Methanoregula sp.]|nr:hypothetical protein [Methanoregula sp.]